MNIDDDVEMWFMYDDNGPLVIKYGNAESHKVYHYELNLQGDIIAIVSTTGERVVEYTYDAWGNVLSITGSAKDTIGVNNPLRYRGYIYDPETQLYYCQSRYYNPEVGRFINADAFTSTGQGLLGNNMFAYCGNNPVNYEDPLGTAHIWNDLFGNHEPGFIHKTVQWHIIATQLFQMELYLPGAGRADIYDPKTGEIWEIKHGGSTTEMQSMRTKDAVTQIRKYVNNPDNIPLQPGHAGAFTGSFVINSGGFSYCVTYDTPQPGVILYYVQKMPQFEPAASYAYKPEENHAYMMGALMIPALGGGGSMQPILQNVYGKGVG